MLPLVMTPSIHPVLLIGNDARACQRLAIIDAGGVDVRVFAPTASAELVVAAGARLVRDLPDADVLAKAPLVFITDIDYASAKRLATMARLVNVEDAPDLCNFHMPSIVRRGDLLLSISTGGRSPRLARRIRQWLDARFSHDWAERLARLAQARTQWRAAGASPSEIVEQSDKYIDKQGWLA